tara:strand:+ start:243 stop:452 length:210 start_codon:yes stop_codon:yes gene_type:complete
MKIALRLSLFLFALFTIGDKAFSLSDYQIKKICKKERKESICIKKLKKKRFNLKEGNTIEIPIIPYKGN